MDLVADLRAAPQGWPSRRAIDLTEDASILTAIANDVGVAQIFQRQVIAYGREGDALVVLSTSGNSENLIVALAEARRRGLRHGRLRRLRRGPDRRRGARRPRDRQPLAAHPADPGGPGVRLPRAARADRALGIEAMAASAAPTRSRRVRAEVLGTVQGVGFRPFVYRLAAELGLGGWVLNDERGVVLEIEGAPAAVDELLARLRSQAPPLAVIESVRVRGRGADRRARLPDPRVGSRRGAGRAGLAGLRDLRRMRRRALRPGRPALSLPVHQLHQLRPALLDRHRRPLRPAADDHGRVRDVRALPSRVRRPARPPLSRPAERLPRMRASGAAHRPRRRVRVAAGRDQVEAAAEMLAAGSIVAIKGIGGYHLACLAADERAVAALRERKHREQKPLALMAPGLEAARALVELTPAEEGLLTDRARPIVVARRRAGARVADAVAPGCPDLGVMLPYSPLHHLLLADVGEAAGDDLREPLRGADRLSRRRRARAARARSPTRSWSTTGRSRSATTTRCCARWPPSSARRRWCCGARAATPRPASGCRWRRRGRCSAAVPSSRAPSASRGASAPGSATTSGTCATGRR